MEKATIAMTRPSTRTFGMSERGGSSGGGNL